MFSFHSKFMQTDRRTTVKQYAPDLSIPGHKNMTCIPIHDKVVTLMKSIFLYLSDYMAIIMLLTMCFNPLPDNKILTGPN